MATSPLSQANKEPASKMEPNPAALDAAAPTSKLAVRSKTALLEAVEDVFYGSVRWHTQPVLV